MKKLLIAASFALAIPAGALANPGHDRTYTAEQWCQRLGEFAFVMARVRDAGYPREAGMQIINESIREATPADEVDAAIAVVDYVYNFPRTSPANEGNDVYQLCIED